MIANGESPRRIGDGDDLSEAVVVFLRHYPGRNDDEFDTRFPAESVRDAVRALIDETMRIRIEWGEKSLIEIGDEVEEVLAERHPELSDPARRKLRNYFTYQVR